MSLALPAASFAWSRVTAFHLDEYVGLPLSHPASFRKYLKERFVDQLPTPLRAFHYIDGEGDVWIDAIGAGLRAARPHFLLNR